MRVWPSSTSPGNEPSQGELADDYGKSPGYDGHGKLAQTGIPQRCGGTTHTGIPAEARGGLQRRRASLVATDDAGPAGARSTGGARESRQRWKQGRSVETEPPRDRSTLNHGKEELLTRITARLGVFNGKPISRGMRISVEMLLNLLSQGASHEELRDDCPELEEYGIIARVPCARAVIAGDSIQPSPCERL